MTAALAACGDSGGATSSVSNSNGDSDGASQGSEATSEGSMSDSMSETEPTEGGMSASGTGTTEMSGSMSNSETMGGGSGNETDGMSSGTGQESQGGSGGSTSTSTGEVPGTTGEPVDCEAQLTKEDCLALDCMPIEGQAFEFDGAIWCLHDAKSFLGCLPQMGCDDAITTVCKGQNNIYQLPNGCFPASYETCDPPPDPGMDGYPSC
ncbi:hypothetical protein [Nannocystis radixulma]|uniref:Lipoprotein n=1 Tax=Nannocystis radixulma TaxID=2995305 RepID=A0ABT5B055_9BACT|nr:hypothetical protein [Nannocystis radixulma]MDC0667479.1 hypothetical protein [Nannocystis radixulma]